MSVHGSRLLPSPGLVVGHLPLAHVLQAEALDQDAAPDAPVEKPKPKVRCSGRVSCQFKGKGKFQDVFMSLEPRNPELTFRVGGSVGRLLRSAKASGCTVSTPRILVEDVSTETWTSGKAVVGDLLLAVRGAVACPLPRGFSPTSTSRSWYFGGEWGTPRAARGRAATRGGRLRGGEDNAGGTVLDRAEMMGHASVAALLRERRGRGLALQSLAQNARRLLGAAPRASHS